MTQLLYIAVTILGIGFLIFIHEAGHYICARFAGVRVMVFSLGFGPRLFGFVRGGTDYRVSAVPLGGYVRVAGEDPTHREDLEPDDLHAKSVAQRTLFFSGGVLMNLLFAVVAFPIVFRAGVEFTAPVLGSVARGGAAWEAGLLPGDRVTHVEDKEMYSFENMNVEIALVGDRDVTLTLERPSDEGTQTLERTVHPRYDEDRGLYTIGIGESYEPDVELELDEDGPAAKAGIRLDDRLVSVGGERIDDNLRKLISELEQSTRYRRDPVTVGVAGPDGAEREVTYTPGSTPLDNPMLGVGPASRLVSGLRGDLRVVERLGLRRGDRILQAGGKPFGGPMLTFEHVPIAERVVLHVLRKDRDGAWQSHQLSAELSAEDRAALRENVALGADLAGNAIDPQPGSPAEVAGLQRGDSVLSIEGRKISDWESLREAVQANADKSTLRLACDTAKGFVEVDVTPAASKADLGLTLDLKQLREPYREESIGGAISAGMVCSLDLIKQLYVTLKRIFTGEVAAKNLGGIITISRVSYFFAQSGWERFIYFLALLSINLAFINVLPIPVLDGGHLMFVLIEGIKGSPVSPRVLNYSQILGLVFIVALLVFVTYNDILRLL